MIWMTIDDMMGIKIACLLMMMSCHVEGTCCGGHLMWIHFIFDQQCESLAQKLKLCEAEKQHVMEVTVTVLL